MIKRISTLIISCGLYGCSIFSPVEPSMIQQYEFGHQVAAPDNSCTNFKYPYNIQVNHTTAFSPYDSYKMFYTTSPYEINSYSYSHWASLPQNIINQLIQRHLIQSCLFSNVIHANFITTSDIRLNTQLIELQLEVGPNSSIVHLIVFAQLINAKNNDIIKHKTFTMQTVVDTSPKGFAIGADKDTEELLNQLSNWLSHIKS